MELVDSATIAKRLRLAHPEQVHGLRTRYADFPEPVRRFGRSFVWDWRAVERWARRTGRLPASKPRRR